MAFDKRYLPLDSKTLQRFQTIEQNISNLQQTDNELQQQIDDLKSTLTIFTSTRTPTFSMSNSGHDRRQTANQASTLNGITSWLRSWVANGGKDPSCTLGITWTLPRILIPVDLQSGYYSLGNLQCAMTVRGFSQTIFDLSNVKVSLVNKSISGVKLDNTNISAWGITTTNTRVYYRGNNAGGGHNGHYYQVYVYYTSEAVVLSFIARSYGEEDDSMNCSMNCTTATPVWKYITA